MQISPPTPLQCISTEVVQVNGAGRTMGVEKVLRVAKVSEMLNFIQISSKTHQAAANLCEMQVVTFVTSV